MSETKNLKLFKHDEPLETNENQFDIKKTLHDNWDKLDEFAGKVNTKTAEIENKQKQHDTDISNIKQEQQDQNIKIENNTTENKDNAELLSQIMGLLPSTKGEGEHVTLDNTAEARFKNFQVQGNSKQETRSGKNKFDGNFSQGYDSSGKITGSSQFVCNTNLINVIQNKTYTISNNLNLKIASIAYYKDNEFVNFKSNIASNTINIPENVNQIRFNLYREQGLSVSEINMCQLEEGEIATDYEPHGASPSPEFPSKIRNVGDNVNFFNKDGNYVEGSAKFEKIETGIKVTVQSAGNYRYVWMDLGGKELLGKTLTMSSNIFVSAQNEPKVLIYAGTKTSPSKSTIKGAELSKSIQAVTFQMPDTFPEGTDSFRVYLYGNFMGTSQIGDYVEYRDFKIEEGTQATAYSPYNCGNAEITVGNKNLANTKIIKNTNIITVNEDGSLTLANNSNTAGYASTGKKLNELCKGLKVGDTAYLKLITTSTNNIYLQGKANQYWLGNNSNKITKDMLEDTVIVYGGYNKTDKLQIQITKNAIGDYAQNEQQTIVFPFTEGQRLYKGDYLAENGMHHVRKQIVPDGTENWEHDSMGGTETCVCYKYKINDYEGYEGTFAPTGKLMCNYLKEQKIYANEQEGIIGGFGPYIFVKVKKSILETPDFPGFKKWLAKRKDEGNPFVIEYPLMQEIIEPYTQEQQEAYNKLKKLHSYNEQTNTFSTNEIGPIFNVEAIKNLNVSVLQQTTKES